MTSCIGHSFHVLSNGRIGPALRPTALSPLPRLQGGPMRRSPPIARVVKRNAAAKDTVIPAPAFGVQLGLLGLAGTSAYFDNYILAGLLGILGTFLIFQTTRLKFCFRPDGLEVVLGESDDVAGNAFVGGDSAWKYDTFTNWEFWWPGFPVLVYFKETQTKPEGQIHFFPIIFNGKELYDVMVERCGTTQNSGPK
ncbi:hypothetical protein BSKO_04402 [Bryopsis sp. KO-2023]|nr:hypothetical protein BSKO_04178 [Bryopsis sp. KO-2023]GMH36534.1 hypothetical protein BSKO_04402 [Bryopsis sp. KO-2023]